MTSSKQSPWSTQEAHNSLLSFLILYVLLSSVTRSNVPRFLCSYVTKKGWRAIPLSISSQLLIVSQNQARDLATSPFRDPTRSYFSQLFI